MAFAYEQKLPTSPLINSVWRSESCEVGQFTSLAVSRSELVITRLRGHSFVAVRGPETRATLADCPPDAEFFGLTLALGSYLPSLPGVQIVDQHAVLLAATGHSFWLNDTAWPLPSYDEADLFVERLVRHKLLVQEPAVAAMLHNEIHDHDPSLRSLQRRFLNATGLSHRAVQHIERARQAVALLEQGHSVQDTIFAAGYSDQSHLTRALKQLVGRTPARIVDDAWPRSALLAADQPELIAR
jgi:Helix-turn-helix domain